ncbi:MAG: dethiobiotin synthase [Legionella sp.]|nr:dethiobiotin synthase [Legionella sp.]
MQYFITGTDTDCGKTYVTGELSRHLNEHHRKTLAIKPIASGCIAEGDQLISEDVTRLQAHNYTDQKQINGWRYKEPVSPHLAARKMGDKLSSLQIANFCEQDEFKEADVLLVEGAGGLLVPFNDDETWLDFLKLTKMPVILVVGMRLGCINHALLTDAVLKLNNIICKGWIANYLEESMLMADEIISTMSAKMHMPLIATVPYCGRIGGFTENSTVFR